MIFSLFLGLEIYLVSKPIHENDFSGLIRFRQSRVDHLPRKIPFPAENLIIRERGYDGQYFYLMALDPFLLKLNEPWDYRRVVDEPVYRYSRIMYPFLINLFSLGSIELFPEVMSLILLFSHFLAAHYLLKIIRHFDKPPLLAFLYCTIPAFIWSLNYSLPESIMGAFLLAGLYYHLESKPLPTILCFAGAILTRESALLFVLILAFVELLKHRRLKSAVLVSSSIAPYILWKIYLTVRLFPDYRFSALAQVQGGFTLPFMGFFDLYQSLILGTYRAQNLYALGYIYPAIVTGIFVYSIRLLWKRVDALSVALFSYSLVYVSLNFDKVWIHMGNGARVTFDAFLILLAAYVSRDIPQDKTLFYLIFVAASASMLFLTPIL